MAQKIKVKGDDGKKTLELEVRDASEPAQETGPEVEAYQQTKSSIVITSGDKILTITIAE